MFKIIWLPIVLIQLFLSSAFAQIEICKNTSTATPEEFEIAQKYIAEALTKFANSKDIAKLADAMLSQLLTAKSPVILSWLKTRQLENKKEDEIVYAWREYFAKNFILSVTPHKDTAINSSVEKLIEDINAKVFSTKFKNEMSSSFLVVKDLAIKKIKSFLLSPEDQNKIIKKINQINLHWMAKFYDSNFKTAPLEFIAWGIAYDPKNNTINMGVNALSYTEPDTILAVLAHEIGHSIDSCRWSSQFSTPWPFQKVGECLRSSLSVSAKIRDDNQFKSELDSQRLTKENATFLKENPTCNKSTYPPIGTQADQLPESFADWFSVEVISQKETLSKNIRSDLCLDKKLNAGSSYVENSKRLTGIYFAHPQLRQTVGITGKSKINYCEFKPI